MGKKRKKRKKRKRRRRKEGDRARVREKARKPLLAKARQKGLNLPEIPTHSHPSHFTLTSPLKTRAFRRRVEDEHTKKGLKKRGRKRRKKKKTYL